MAKRKSRVDRVKKKTVSWYRKKAWTVFSKWIRERDKGVCYTCQRRGLHGSIYHAGHFISRRHNATLFNEMNVHGQCINCNMWDYGNSGVYAQNLIRDYGKEKFDELVAKGKTIKQFTIKELENIIEKYD